MRRSLPYIVTLVLVLASGIVNGLWTGRWSGDGRRGGHAEVIRDVPAAIGAWEGQDEALDRRMIEAAELDGYLLRHYRNPRGDVVTLLIVRGRPGPISVHTPEVCYGGAGYSLSAPLSRFPVVTGPTGRSDEFWVADLTKPGVVAPETLRILYGWSTDGAWTASGTPRLEFADADALHKMYIIRRSARPGEPIRDDVLVAFARQLLPELRRTLFAGPDSGA